MEINPTLPDRRAIEKNIDGSSTEYDFVAPSQDILEKLFRELFERHWKEITFGSCVQGAVFEIKLSEPAKKISSRDGYLTVDTGPWHFHLCIGEHKGTQARPTPPELAKHRRATKAAFFRDVDLACGLPRSWGFRLWNGKGEQMITIFFPNPYYNEKSERQEPDWSKLALWERLRKDYAS